MCRMVNDKLRPMIECDLCQNWFHLDCVGLKLDGEKLNKWSCTICRDTFSDNNYDLKAIIIYNIAS